MDSTNVACALLSAKLCSDSLCSLTSVEYVPVELIVKAL